jgi:hypothetical protein
MLPAAQHLQASHVRSDYCWGISRSSPPCHPTLVGVTMVLVSMGSKRKEIGDICIVKNINKMTSFLYVQVKEESYKFGDPI